MEAEGHLAEAATAVLGSIVSRGWTDCVGCCAVIGTRQMCPSCRLFNDHMNNM